MTKSPTKEQVTAALAFYATSMPGGRVIRHAECPVAQVPPWRFLQPGVPIDQAVSDAARALGITERLAIIGLFWDMRRLAEEGTAQ